MTTQPTIDTWMPRRLERAAEAIEYFETLLACTPVRIPETGLLAGPLAMNVEGARQKLRNAGRPCMPGADNLHFAMNLSTLFRLGLGGIASAACERARNLTGEEATYLGAIARCYEAVVACVATHADEAERLAALARGPEQRRLSQITTTCRALTRRAPQTLLEAVQLFWLSYVCRGQGTIGRLDQHLWPFYQADDAAAAESAPGQTYTPSPFDLLCELWQNLNRASTGDTLRNVMLGGQDRQGADATNALSYLMLDVSRAVHQPEPHLNVRLHARTPSAFLDKVAEVQLLGHGQAAVYNDEALVPSLVTRGVPLTSARNYANDGCSEVTIDGESGIIFVQMEDLKALELTLFNGAENTLPGPAEGRYILKSHQPRNLKTTLVLGYRTGDFAAMTSFEEVYDAFLRQYLYQVERKLEYLCERVRRAQCEEVSSPFLAGTYPTCLETGRDPFRGGFAVPCYILFAGSLPTVADALAAIRQVVFDEHACTPGELLEALRANWEGYEGLRRRCLAAPKFGNDDDRVDLLAADIARRFCDYVVRYPTPTGKPFWPALYNFLFNDYAKTVGATPDGRRWQDPIAEHYSPTPGRARRGPTAVIRSAAKGPLAAACGSSMLHVTLPRTLVPADESGRVLLRQLLDAALSLGVAVMDTAIYDVQALREAQREPEKHRDLIVRVWGFSAYFVELSADMQTHIIQRAVQGTV